MSQLPSRGHTSQEKIRQSAAAGVRAMGLAIVVSIGLGAVKIIAGILGHSYALVADGVESMLDVVSGLVVAGSLKIAAEPPSEEYPYGRGKVEPVAALVISIGLLAAAAAIAIQSVREILTPHHAPAAFTLVVLVVVVAAKELLFRYLFRAGESTASGAMRTDAWHHRSDALTSAAAFIGISVSLAMGEGYESADDWAALFAAGVIGFNGVNLLRTAWREIMDAALPEYIVEEIRVIAGGVDGVAGIDMCRVRKSGLGLWVDIHVEVRGDMTVRAGHEIAHRVKDALSASRHNVMDAVVHIEPMESPP
jgi:cation diffusion facilitator family transporter